MFTRSLQIILLVVFLFSFTKADHDMTPGCMVQGYPPKHLEEQPQPLENMEICQWYENSACCNYSQQHFFYTNFVTAVNFFGGCPGCLNNIRRTWCGYTCGPAQKHYITTKVKLGEEPKHPNFTICRRWAKAVYESCQWIHFAKSMWQTYEEFWVTQGSEAVPVQILITYPEDDDDPNAFCPLDELQKCEDTCDCLNCPPGCENSSDIKYKDDDKKIGGLTPLKFWIVLIGSIIGASFLVVVSVRIAKSVLKGKKSSQGYNEIN
ncbi:npc intracellular cholesterol transporter [Anaeramoeba flamelloides]|uniref:Npc intracellular cholesterol transporter n=1 Tax=Anaeramoeba flamelloides TaxID=1746091 RepID=A0AAV7ZML8_9EUKA|nr:npc intracellular cholesterol transporter [Anaeramoeba flamelloides]